jgi:hypothetical protein
MRYSYRLIKLRHAFVLWIAVPKFTLVNARLNDSSPAARMRRQPLALLGRTVAQFASDNQQLQGENWAKRSVLNFLTSITISLQWLRNTS